MVRKIIQWLLYKSYYFSKLTFFKILSIYLFWFYTVKPFFRYYIDIFRNSLLNINSPTLIRLINLFIFFFVAMPFWFFNEFIKFYWGSLKSFLFSKFFNKYNSFIIYRLFIITIFCNTYKFLYACIYKFIRFLKNTIMDFLYFDVYRNRVYLNNIFVNTLAYFIYVGVLYYSLYSNFWNLIHNFFCNDFLEDFSVWDTDTYRGILFLFVWVLNFDNLFLLLYIISFKLGAYIVIFNNNYFYIKVWNYWQLYYIDYRFGNKDFSFFKYFFDNFYTRLNFKLFELNNPFVCFDESTPYFFFFGFLFFFTVLVSWVFFSYLGLYGIYKLNLITLFFFWLSLLFSTKFILMNQKVYLIKLCSWVFLTINYKIDFCFLVDTISFSFMLLTTTIALFVYIFAFAYFRYEPLVDRFLLFILSFVISMILLVTSGNTILLFLGWELIGFTSFCLINFWTTKATTLKSAFKAFSFNKFSDFFMFMFLISTYSTFYTFDVYSLNNQICLYKCSLIYIFGIPVNCLEFISLMLIGAAFIKSAQFCSHVWLPDSMEAPVPASSLIHSATLVSAGIYLILRFNYIFDYTQYSKFMIPVIGSLTAAYGGVCAVAQSDIKKTLAYSTISHCGFLMVLCATEMNEFTILYLYVHGFFKAGVFMCVGNVLRITRGYQDSRKMGGLLKFLPFEYFCILIGILNLAGLPFTFGFCIKHLLLLNLGSSTYLYSFVMFNSLLGAFSGIFYSYRILNYTFNDLKKGPKILYLNTSKHNYNSFFYTNSSLAATFSISGIYIMAYIILYFFIKYFLAGNFLFSDYMNNTVLTNYYATTSIFSGYLLNFSYVNTTVYFILIFLFFSKFKKIPRLYSVFSLIATFTLFILLYFTLFFVF